MKVTYRDSSGMTLLPPRPDVCQMCAVDHAPYEAHDLFSLYYGVRFKMTHGRDPTWADATAHLDPDVRSLWRKALDARGAWSEPQEGIEPIAEPC